MRTQERGVALILVLVVLPLIAIIMTQLSFETTIGDRLASNVLANQQFKQAILARIRQLRLRLVRDLNDDEKNAQQQGAFDHYGDLWGPDTQGGNTAVKVTKGDREMGDEVTLYTEVKDEQAKFNLNMLLQRDAQRAARALEVFKNLLNFYRDSRFDDIEDNEYDLDESEVEEIATAVLKFLKGDERDERVRKAELPDPTPEMRQGIYTIDDLVFSHRIFHEKRILERFTDVDSGQSIPGLRDFVTIYGDGKINVNTAPIQVLRAMFKEEQGQREVAENIYHGRGGYLNTDEDQDRLQEDREERERLEEEGRIDEEEEEQEAYKSLNDLNRVEGMGDGAFLRRNEVDVARDFTVRTNFFSVTVTARRDNFLRQHRVVFERHGKGTITWATGIRAVDLGDLPHEASETETGETVSE